MTTATAGSERRPQASEGDTAPAADDGSRDNGSGWSANDPEVDRALVAAAQSGCRSSFDQLVTAYQQRVFNLALRMTSDHDEAADVAQEAFVKAFRALPNFRKDARFSTWIYRITVNASLSRHRKQAVRRRHAPLSLDAAIAGSDGELSLDPADLRHEPARETTRDETIRMVQREIQSLDSEFRVVVLLRDVEGYAYEEIAEILGCPIGTVRSRLHRARHELGRRLKRQLDAS